MTNTKHSTNAPINGSHHAYVDVTASRKSVKRGIRNSGIKNHAHIGGAALTDRDESSNRLLAS